LTKEGRPSYSQGSFERATAELLKSQKSDSTKSDMEEKISMLYFSILKIRLLNAIEEEKPKFDSSSKIYTTCSENWKNAAKKKQTKSLNFL